MKTIYNLILLLLISTSCKKEDFIIKKVENKEFNPETIVIDSCEYLLFRVEDNNALFRYGGITHKGNCKNH